MRSGRIASRSNLAYFRASFYLITFFHDKAVKMSIPGLIRGAMLNYHVYTSRFIFSRENHYSIPGSNHGTSFRGLNINTTMSNPFFCYRIYKYFSEWDRDIIYTGTRDRKKSSSSLLVKNEANRVAEPLKKLPITDFKWLLKYSCFDTNG